MDKRKLSDIVRSKRTVLSAVLCLVALGAVSGVTSYRESAEDRKIVLEPNQDAVPYEMAEETKPVISSKNAETKVEREDVLTVVEEYSYDEEYEAVASISNEFILNWPVAGDIVMDFSDDALIYDVTLDQYRTNDSVSISAQKGDIVSASSAGVVKEVNESAEDGWYVVIDHENGWETTYGQLQEELAVEEGERVVAGEMVGYVAEPSIYGSLLGEHVEFKVTLNDYAIDPKTAVGENIGE